MEVTMDGKLKHAGTTLLAMRFVLSSRSARAVQACAAQRHVTSPLGFENILHHAPGLTKASTSKRDLATNPGLHSETASDAMRLNGSRSRFGSAPGRSRRGLSKKRIGAVLEREGLKRAGDDQMEDLCRTQQTTPGASSDRHGF
jgi:hypothetical protein